MTGPKGAAENLLGRVLLEKWLVVEQVERDKGASSEARSSCYRAADDAGNAAFVKAYDFRGEERKGDIQKLENMAREFNHEKRVHELCVDKKLARVTRIYGSGSMEVDGETVHFLICEYAPQSLREAHPPGDCSIRPSQRLHAMRHVAAGLAQLHSIRVAHQDIKPSNAVAFVDNTIKITDLGSSSCEDMPPAPHDDLSYCGQPNYAPLELLYNTGGTWYGRRVGCDMYLLGNLVFTSFVGESITYLIAHMMPDELRHTNFTGEYEQVLPMLVDIHLNYMPIFLQQSVPKVICEDLTKIILEMCHPDPEARGHPLNRMGRGARYGLERYISAFDRMALICARSEKNV